MWHVAKSPRQGGRFVFSSIFKYSVFGGSPTTCGLPLEVIKVSCGKQQCDTFLTTLHISCLQFHRDFESRRVGPWTKWGLRQTCLDILRRRKSEEQKDQKKAGEFDLPGEFAIVNTHQFTLEYFCKVLGFKLWVTAESAFLASVLSGPVGQDASGCWSENRTDHVSRWSKGLHDNLQGAKAIEKTPMLFLDDILTVFDFEPQTQFCGCPFWRHIFRWRFLGVKNPSWTTSLRSFSLVKTPQLQLWPHAFASCAQILNARTADDRRLPPPQFLISQYFIYFIVLRSPLSSIFFIWMIITSLYYLVPFVRETAVSCPVDAILQKLRRSACCARLTRWSEMSRWAVNTWTRCSALACRICHAEHVACRLVI